MRYRVMVTGRTLYHGASAKKALEAFNIGRTVLEIGWGSAMVTVHDGKTEALYADYNQGIGGAVVGPSVFTGLGKK